jgi:hypothetical protein
LNDPIVDNNARNNDHVEGSGTKEDPLHSSKDGQTVVIPGVGTEGSGTIEDPLRAKPAVEVTIKSDEPESDPVTQGGGPQAQGEVEVEPNTGTQDDGRNDPPSAG